MRTERIYLDFNATVPLNSSCKRAMIEAMSLVGNASSVHSEGRQVRSLVENAREKIAESLDAEPENLIFTSGATEGAALLLKGTNRVCAGVEHPCVSSWCEKSLRVKKNGKIEIINADQSAVQLANSETGILQELPENLYMSDIVQAVGKVHFSFKKSGISSVIISGHKIGGPPGVGAVVTKPDFEVEPQLIGGGQEKGRRSGTENLISIVGFAAALEASKQEFYEGNWEEVKELRNFLEDELANVSPDTIFIGKEHDRLPNTSCIVTPGWIGQTQVMQMDLAGCSISAGSACSSGKIGESDTLTSMGWDRELANCSIRVSIGTTTTKSEIRTFVKEWSRVKIDRKRKVA